MINKISTKFKHILDSRFKNIEIACINPKYAYEYAMFNNLKKFELGEAIIATDSKYSYFYAYNILDGPFKLGEPAIATNAYKSYMYSILVLKRRFHLGERIISKSDFFKKKYDWFYNGFSG